MENQTHYLKELLDYLNLNASKFAKSIGIKQPTSIYGILNYKLKMSDNIADKIVGKYPRVNRKWLLTGAGKMLNIANSKSAEDNAISFPLEERASMPKSIPYDFVKSLMDERVRTDKLHEELIRLHGLLIEKQLELFSKIADNQKEILEAFKQQSQQEEKINSEAELPVSADVIL